MQEGSHIAVGVDVGTSSVKVVVAHVDDTSGALTVIGTAESPNSGMRKGVIVHLNGPAQAIDQALITAEKMSNQEVEAATVSINGSHLVSSRADGMVAVGSPDHEITGDDMRRVEEVATMGKIPANREILDIIPHHYKLDGQEHIKDPRGMTGTRLEVDALVLSALTPYVVNLQKAAEQAKLDAHTLVPSAIASARAVLTESQREHGVAVIDIGATTTGLAVYEEGELQYSSVVPMGSQHITNDLAIGLKTDPEIAEKIKRDHASAVVRSDNGGVSVRHDGEILNFFTNEIDDIVEARLEEIFEAVQTELKKAGRAGKLPSGVVITGGGAELKHIAEFAKNALGLAARVGKPHNLGGVTDAIENPRYTTAVGLLLIDSEGTSSAPLSKKSNTSLKNAQGFLNKIVARFKA